MATQTDAVWMELAVETLDAKTQGAYAAYKKLYAEMKTQREAFEAMCSAEAQVPAGKRMVFGYRFGKLSVAIVDDDRKAKSASSKGAVSLADYLKAQANR